MCVGSIVAAQFSVIVFGIDWLPFLGPNVWISEAVSYARSMVPTVLLHANLLPDRREMFSERVGDVDTVFEQANVFFPSVPPAEKISYMVFHVSMFACCSSSLRSAVNFISNNVDTTYLDAFLRIIGLLPIHSYSFFFVVTDFLTNK